MNALAERTRTTKTSSGGAAVLAAPREVQVRELAVREPAPREVLVRMEGCGVCASNIPLWEGRPWFSYPLEPGAPGHEGWGRVEACGREVHDLETGQRVAILSQHAYAEYDIADAEAVVPLPAALDQQSFPAEPLGCAMNIFRRSRIGKDDTVAILGIGFLGALLTQLASAAGARVIAITRRPFALEIARRFGAAHTIAMEDHSKIVEEMKQITGGAFCDVVIEATGKQWPLDLAGELTRVRGRLIIAGYHQDGLRQINLQLWNWRGLDVINAHERDPRIYVEGMRLAIDAVQSGLLTPQPLYTHTFSLAALGEALRMTSERPDGFMKALIRI
jgi:2-desacetyl-2-hydroxyethyl bacteriochlorophyllide A dehydrogenase